jgi:modulator of FtsH protease HflK
MAWDDGDKGNPWRSDKDKGPADLDAVVRDLQRKLAGLFRGGGSGGRSPGGDQGLSSGLTASALVVLALVWGSFGFYRVDAAERGVEFRFGAFQGLTQPGLQWHWPWPIESAETINTGATVPFEYRAGMLTRDENIVNVSLVVQFRRTDPQTFIFNVRDPEATLEAATASAIREVVGRNMLDFILTEGRTEVSAQTQDLLQATLDAYGTGITIYEVNLVGAEFPSEVEVAVQDSIRAREDRERRILEAQTYSNDILPRARGEAERRRQEAEAYREQVVADAEGESDRFTQVLAEYEKAPAVTRERIYIETLEEILSTSTKVLVDTEGGNNLLYLPLDQLMQRRPSTPPADPTPTSVPAAPAPSTGTDRSRDRATTR